MAHWWEKEPLRITEICNSFQFGALSLQEEADAVKKMVGNAQHFHCTDNTGGGDDCSCGLHDSNRGKGADMKKLP